MEKGAVAFRSRIRALSFIDPQKQKTSIACFFNKELIIETNQMPCYNIITPVKNKILEGSMQVNIGTKIKELRKRDGRTQDAMANAIGVTAQAISRWEANGGYPDMEIIPSIANYFGITIEQLSQCNLRIARCVAVVVCSGLH